MAITKETIKAAIDQLDETSLPALYQTICELREGKRENPGRRMAAVLRRMANRNALAHIADPVEWQREIREDRPLRDRE